MKRKIFFSILTATIIFTVTVYFLFPGFLVKVFMNYERCQSGLSEKMTQVGDHTITYLDGGSGDTILMIHGYGGDKDNWTRFSRHLTEAYRVVIPDLPGFGKSTKIKSASYDIDSQTERIHLFTTKLGIKKCHIIGHSMGGNIAAHYAIKYPKQTSTLALFNAAGVIAPVKSHFLKSLEKGENLLVTKDADDYKRLMKYIFVNPPSLPGPIYGYLAQKATEARAFNEKVMEDLIKKPVIVTPYLPSIKHHSFILWGDTDRILDVSSINVFKKHLPYCTTVVMEDSGHMPMLERPKEAADHYKKFLTEKE